MKQKTDVIQKGDKGEAVKERLPEAKKFFEDENGIKWGFNFKTPPKFRFNGVVKTKQEWLEDHDAMELLVYGKSAYVIQLKK